MQALKPLLFLPLTACLTIGTGSSDDAGTTTTAAASDAGTAATTTTGATVTTSGCATDPTTNTTLCSSVSTCPSSTINHTTYPDCGFVARGSSFDIQCWCTGYLCTMGSATTCNDAVTLFANNTEDQVCELANEGKCTQPQKGATTTTCTSDCQDGCNNDPTCLKACGC